MEGLSTSFWATLALVFVWGAKHGLDADHLATIDGLTRYNVARGDARGRYCGLFFSLGHGLVVVAVAVGVSIWAAGWQVPAWLEGVGAWLSIGFLSFLAWLNLRAVWRTPQNQVVRLAVGPRGRLFRALSEVRHPALVALVGALFAVSFDTLSQAALFAVTAGQFGGAWAGLLLGLAFLFGMLLCDALNGLWLARLLAVTDRRAAIASRVMGVAVASLALAVAGFGLAKQLSPLIDHWAEGTELVFGMTVLAVVALSFWLALHLSAPRLSSASWR